MAQTAGPSANPLPNFNPFCPPPPGAGWLIPADSSAPAKPRPVARVAIAKRMNRANRLVSVKAARWRCLQSRRNRHDLAGQPSSPSSRAGTCVIHPYASCPGWVSSTKQAAGPSHRGASAGNREQRASSTHERTEPVIEVAAKANPNTPTVGPSHKARRLSRKASNHPATLQP